MKKTALQEAIEKIEDIQDNWKDNSEVWNAYQVSCSIIESLLEKEKQDLIDTYLEGAMDSPLNSPNDAKDYYKQNFEK